MLPDREDASYVYQIHLSKVDGFIYKGRRGRLLMHRTVTAAGTIWSQKTVLLSFVTADLGIQSLYSHTHPNRHSYGSDIITSTLKSQLLLSENKVDISWLLRKVHPSGLYIINQKNNKKNECILVLEISCLQTTSGFQSCDTILQILWIFNMNEKFQMATKHSLKINFVVSSCPNQLH